ncbi:MAG: DUF1549 domain-containing protein, partial [Planctomycetota bacterium]
MDRPPPATFNLLASIFLLLGFVALTESLLLESAEASAPGVDFRSEVLPLLSDRCFQCHGPDAETRHADLRLDERSAAVDAGAIAPGDASQSELVRRIFSADEFETMPPPESGKRLNARERDILKAWVDQGAEYQRHWSFVPPQRREPTTTTDLTWGRNPIDRLAASKLASNGLSPSKEADRYTLARRLAFDLTGLPPSQEEVSQFVEDSRPDAYERYVERLLESPHYGERMALDWLDSSRYADTNGYSIDGGRHMWLWRDWVID